MHATPRNRNPWLAIPASDYEGHMGPGHADQLAPLSAIFGEVYRDVRPARLALLGCATGNGLEHVDPAITRRAVAIDLNPEYVALAASRNRALGSALEVYCADVCTCELPAASFDLVYAALLFEHVDPALLASRITGWLAPGGTCAVVLQVDPPWTARVTPSPFRSIASLDASMRMVSPEEVADLLSLYGLRLQRRWNVALKNAKQLSVALFRWLP